MWDLFPFMHVNTILILVNLSYRNGELKVISCGCRLRMLISVPLMTWHHLTLLQSLMIIYSSRLTHRTETRLHPVRPLLLNLSLQLRLSTDNYRDSSPKSEANMTSYRSTLSSHPSLSTLVWYVNLTQGCLCILAIDTYIQCMWHKN